MFWTVGSESWIQSTGHCAVAELHGITRLPQIRVDKEIWHNVYVIVVSLFQVQIWSRWNAHDTSLDSSTEAAKEVLPDMQVTWRRAVYAYAPAGVPTSWYKMCTAWKMLHKLQLRQHLKTTIRYHSTIANGDLQVPEPLVMSMFFQAKSCVVAVFHISPCSVSCHVSRS